jgi:ABC-type multidrug transport system fused ATPase/permease subunit
MDKPSGFWRSTRVLLRFKRRLAAALAGAVVSAACFGAGIGMILPASYLVLQQGKSLRDMVAQKLLAGDHPWGRALGRWLWPLVPDDIYHGFLLIIAASVALSLLSMAGDILHGLSVSRLLQRVARDKQNQMFRHALETSAAAMWQRGPQEVISRMTGDLNALIGGYTTLLGKGVQKVLMGLVALGMALWLNWGLCLITLAIAPPVVLVIRWTSARIRQRFGELQDRRSRMQARVHETFGHFDVLKLNGAERFERRRFSRVTRDIEITRRQMTDMGMITGPAVELLTVVGFAAVAAAAGWMVLRQGVDALELLAVLALLGIVGRSLQVLVGMQSQINVANRAMERIEQVFELPLERAGDEHRPALPRHAGSIRFERVSFTYPDAQRPAVDQVSFEVPFGATVAIVGANGSGKTTLLSLLTRLFEPTAGRIEIDGHDITRFRLRSLRDQVAVVPQQPAVFASSIQRNIAYGLPHVGLERVVEAAKLARADDFIVSLPEGYRTQVGPKAVQLSGGEKQRLCLARAILRQPAILILDEATSQIDGDSEEKINQALSQLRAGRTTFVIAHRLTTMIGADHIVVLDRGKVVGRGTHESLLAGCEAYRQLTQSQLRLMSRDPVRA